MRFLRSVLYSEEQEPDSPHVYTVSELNVAVRELLEGEFPSIWLEGEISDLARPASGHLYFSLKDDRARVRCALFKNRRVASRSKIENGLLVKVKTRISVYEARGEYQLLIEELQPAGDGALQRAFEALRAKLESEGLFNEALRKPIPEFPRRVGVITSASGAAVRDVITALQRRYPALPVLIYPTLVQGASAPAQIVAAIDSAERRQECDVLLLVRGGGSLEDLAAFNDEGVARAIHRCTIPIISGVGHETDFTIADFVADLRAPTPTAAAEFASPDRERLSNVATRLLQRLTYLQQERLRHYLLKLSSIQNRLHNQHPGKRLNEQAQRLDELEQRMTLALRQRIGVARHRIDHVGLRLQHQGPAANIAALKEKLNSDARRLELAMNSQIESAKQKLLMASRTLNAVSPLGILGRGYALVEQYPEGNILRKAEEVQPGDTVKARLGKGSLWCTVNGVNKV